MDWAGMCQDVVGGLDDGVIGMGIWLCVCVGIWEVPKWSRSILCCTTTRRGE